MTMAYIVMSLDEQDEIVVAFFLAQEKDHFSHTINKERYEVIIAVEPIGRFTDRLQELLAETNSRLNEVTAIIEATRNQLPDPQRVTAARLRLNLV